MTRLRPMPCTTTIMQQLYWLFNAAVLAHLTGGAAGLLLGLCRPSAAASPNDGFSGDAAVEVMAQLKLFVCYCFNTRSNVFAESSVVCE